MSDAEPFWKVFKGYWEFGFRFQPGKTATAACAKTLSTHNRNLVSVVLVAIVLLRTDDFCWVNVHSNRYWPHKPGCPASSTLQVSSCQS